MPIKNGLPANDVELKRDKLQTPLLVSTKHAAQMLSISERSLWTWTHRGDIPHVRVGRTIRYSVDTLNRWIQTRQNYTLPA